MKIERRVDFERLDSRLLPVVQQLANATVPLCQRQMNVRVPRPVGSGVLLGIQGHRYLLTASHVFEHALADSPVYAIVSSAFVAIGNRWRTKPSPRSKGRDRADLAIVPLGSETDDPWASCRMQTLDEVDPSLNPLDLDPSTGFLAIGYPNSKQPQVLKNGSYSPLAHHFLTHLEPNSHRSGLGLVPELHLAVGFNPRDFNGSEGRRELPKPVGMSGGGLWRIPSALGTQFPEPHLVGILIEHYAAPDHLVVATRLAPVLRALAHLDPGTRTPITARFPGLFSDA